MTSKKNVAYDESSIGVLEGLEPVQHRPGMYTRTENPNHILQEVADNAFDEALGGYASQVLVELHEDGSVSIEDNGRGIPVGPHPKLKKPTVEVVFTVLHAGGKFNKSGDAAYAFTGGLHGVGVSVTNALSERLEVTIWRDGQEHRLVFSHGKVIEPLTSTKLPKDQKDRHGTRVHVWPCAKYFDNGHVQVNEFERFLRSKAVLLKQVEVTWVRPQKMPIVWHFPGGISQYLEEQVDSHEMWAAPRFHTALYHQEGTSGFDAGEGFELALGFLYEGRLRESYVNLIPTPQGGRHETGLKAGLFEAVMAVAERNKSIPKELKLESDDVWQRAAFVLSTKILDPQFQNQTKDKMTSERGHRLVQGLVRDAFELWLNDHPDAAKAIIDVAVQEAIRRQRAGAKVERKRGSGASVLPGKLSDCDTKDVEMGELFLVEGDSAGGSSKQARDRIFQAIMPLRGKLKNTWDDSAMKIAESEAIADIATAIGLEPHGDVPLDQVDFSRLRYGKVFIMSDADVDGQHIQVLLMTLFLRHFPGLIHRGHLWIAQPPLFRVDAPPKRGQKGGNRKFYALDTDELAAIEKALQKENLTPTQYTISRFKGLGEMNPAQLRETTLDPETRRVLKVTVPDNKLALEAFDLMVNNKNAKQRRDWMEAEGAKIEVDV